MASSGPGALSISKNLAKDFMEPRSVQVVLRIRGRGDDDDCDLATYKIDGDSFCLEPPLLSKLSKASSNTLHRFTFNQIFDQGSTQQEVFQSTAQTLAQNLVAGESGLLFNYGVSNSGKTFTLQGTPSDPGLVPRTLDLVFQLVGNTLATEIVCQPSNGSLENVKPSDLKKFASAKAKLFKMVQDKTGRNNLTELLSNISLMPLSSTMLDCTKTTCAASTSTSPDLTDISTATTVDACASYGYTAWISFVEIYNDNVYDLFSIVKSTRRIALIPCSTKDDDLYIRGILEIPVSSADEAYRLFLAGQKNLHMAATKLNYNSSRSHCCFFIRLVSCQGNGVGQSVLTLCDLAGSERNSKTDSIGDRLYEAGKINNSLLVLGRCMELLRSNPSNIMVPYRDSKLTHLFKSFLTGKGKTMSIVNVGLQANIYDETIHALKFSAITREVLLPPSIEVLKFATKNSRKEIRNLRRTLSNIGNCTALSIQWEDEAMRPSSDFSTHSDDEGENEEDSFGESGQNLISIINCLKGLLFKAIKEKETIEVAVRNELCDMHSAATKNLRHYYNERLQKAEERHNRYESERRELIVGMHQEKKRELMLEHSSRLQELEMEKEETMVENGILLGEIESLKEDLTEAQTAAAKIQQKYTKLQLIVANVQQQMHRSVTLGTVKKRVSFSFGSRTPFKELIFQSAKPDVVQKSLSPMKSEPSCDFKDFDKVVQEFVKTNKENMSSLQLENLTLKKQLDMSLADTQASKKMLERLQVENMNLKQNISLSVAGSGGCRTSAANITMNGTAYYSMFSSGSGSGSGSTNEGGSGSSGTASISEGGSNERPAFPQLDDHVFKSPVLGGADKTASPAPVKSIVTFDAKPSVTSECSDSSSKSDYVTPSEKLLASSQTDGCGLLQHPQNCGPGIECLEDSAHVLPSEKRELLQKVQCQEVKIEQLEAIVKTVTDEKQVLEERVQQQNMDIERLNDTMETIIGDKKDALVDCKRRDDEIKLLHDTIHVLTGEKKELVQELSFARGELCRLAGRADVEKTKTDDATETLRAKIKKLESHVWDLTQSLSDKDLELVSAVQQRKTLASDMAVAEEKICRHDNDIAELKKTISDKQVKISSLKNNVDTFERERVALQKALADGDEQVARLKTKKCRLEDTVAHLEKVVTEDELKINALKEDLQFAVDALATKTGELLEAQSKLNGLQVDHVRSDEFSKSSNGQSPHGEIVAPKVMEVKPKSKRGKSRKTKTEKKNPAEAETEVQSTVPRSARKFSLTSNDETYQAPTPATSSKKRQLLKKQDDGMLMATPPESSQSSSSRVTTRSFRASRKGKP